MSRKSFVKGAAILAAAGLISKFIGALFRIPHDEHHRVHRHELLPDGIPYL